MTNSIKRAYLNQQIQLATELAQTAQDIFTKTFELAKQWDLSTEDSVAPVVTPPPAEENPVAAPPEPLKPSERARLRRAQAAAKTPALPEQAGQVPLPIPADQPMVAPVENIFSEGIPMCMDPLPTYPVFHAMFQKKYGPNGRCRINLMGREHMYTAPELYEMLGKIRADGDQVDPMAKAFYGTVMSVVIHQYGSVIEPEEKN